MIWYAVKRDNADEDWGYGSHDLEEAKKMCLNIGTAESHIDVIDDTDSYCLGVIPHEEVKNVEFTSEREFLQQLLEWHNENN